LSTARLVNGNTIGIDATTLEANAALRSIVRRDSGESYEEFLTTVAKAWDADRSDTEEEGLASQGMRQQAWPLGKSDWERFF
jgi:transposase